MRVASQLWLLFALTARWAQLAVKASGQGLAPATQTTDLVLRACIGNLLSRRSVKSRVMRPI